MSARNRDAGYAMVAAVAAIAVVGLMSLTLIDTGRGIAEGVAADAEHARLAAAADAGFATAARALAETDPARRWSIDLRPHHLRFDGADLDVAVEDERGKIPLNQLTEEQMRALFETLGASGDLLRVQTDSTLDWLDDDDEPREAGAEAGTYVASGIHPRNGALRSLDELVLVRGVTPAIVERLRAAATVYRNQRAGFDDRFALPLAMSVMSGGGADTPAIIDRERELAGQRPAIAFETGETLVGRPLTIRVEARLPGGGRFVRRTLIELTGRPAAPYVVRGVD